MTGPMRTRAPIEDVEERAVSTRHRKAVHDVETGSLSETVAGAGAVVLGVLGIFGLLPGVLDSIATIGAGFAVLVGSMALGARAARLIGERVASHREIGGGLGLAAMAGLAGVVLGILALLGVSRVELLSVTPVVLGAALLIGSAAMARFEQLLRIERGTEAVYVASGAEALIGVGAVVLGILALSGIASLTLSLVAVLSVGAAVLMSGTSLTSQLLTLTR
jgi:hypothetical protein